MKRVATVLLSTIVIFASPSRAQNHIPVFDGVLFYDGYAQTVTHPVPSGVIRHRNDLFATRLTDQQLQAVGDEMVMHVVIKASCDNYDRIGNVNLALVPKGQAAYDPESVERIEVGRFITPFMNKNIMPDTVSYRFEINNITLLLRDADVRARYDIWAELEVFGVPYAANSEVDGCAGRDDVFYGSLSFETNTPAEAVSHHVLKPLSFKAAFNNYNAQATDEIGKTERTISFTLEENLTDAALYLITSNHGAGSGGEEYNRRNHFVYLNDNQIHRYVPGSQTCEPFRKYNTQPNGIYGRSPKTDEQWQFFSNWCPGDVIPIRRIHLGALSAGTHTFRISVPDARFVGSDGNIPLSLYLQGKTRGLLSLSGKASFPDIRIYPNPVSDVLYVESPFPVSLSVHSMDGRVMSIRYGGDSIPLQGMPEGVYMLQVRDAQGDLLTTKRVLKAGR